MANNNNNNNNKSSDNASKSDRRPSKFTDSGSSNDQNGRPGKIIHESQQEKKKN